mgnify:FL=1
MEGSKRYAATLLLSVLGLASISSFEGTKRVVYLDPVGVPTACTGHTATVTHKDVGKVLSDEHCAWLLRQDAKDAERAVQRLVTVPVTQNQYDALVDFTFNKGEGALANSTLLRKINAGDCKAAGLEFRRWVYAGRPKRVLPGLVKRAAWQEAKWLSGC